MLTWREYGDSYLWKCPDHFRIVRWRMSEWDSQYYPEQCPTCKYESRKKFLAEQRALGWSERKQRKAVVIKQAKGMCEALKSLYSSDLEYKANPLFANTGNDNEG